MDKLVFKIDTTRQVAWKEHEMLYTPSQTSEILNPCLSVNEESHFWHGRRSETN